MCRQIVGDAVGWGFVVRGNRPCHIQAVEPCGPAAAAGMKVGIMGNVVNEFDVVLILKSHWLHDAPIIWRLVC